MTEDSFKSAKTVLIFNGAGIYLGKMGSVNATSDLTYDASTPQAISAVCSGKYIAAGSHYFRYENDNVQVDDSDINKLKLSEYDKLCGQKRSYHSPRLMSQKSKKAKAKYKSSKKEKEDNNDE